MVVEDDYAVEAVVLGYVRGRGRVLALYAAEDVGRRAFLWVTERVSLGRCYLAVEVEADACVEWAGGPQPVEERAFQGDTVRDLHDALGGDVVHRGEGLLDPGLHRLRRVEASCRRGHVEDAVCEDAILRGEGGDQGPKVSYLAFSRHRLRGPTLLQAGIYLVAVDIRGEGALRSQLPLDDLTGKEHRVFGRAAIEGGCEEACQESIPGTCDVDDLDGPGGNVGGDTAVLGDEIALLAHGEHDGLGAEVVEHLDVLLGFVVGAEDPPGVGGGLGHVDVAVGIADDPLASM